MIGVENDLRRQFFGAAGSTASVVAGLCASFSRYSHYAMDIRDREAVRDLFKRHRPDLVIHTAAQPSHDKAASIPYEDFDVNAGGTLNLLVAGMTMLRKRRFALPARTRFMATGRTASRWWKSLRVTITPTGATGSMKACRLTAPCIRSLVPRSWPRMFFARSLAVIFECRWGYLDAAA